MDSIKGQKQQTGIKLEKTQILKKALQFLISLCVFCFLLSHSSMISFLDLSFNLYFSTFSAQLFDYTIERKYMFLLCNGILVFLAMNSGLISSSPLETAGIHIHDELHRRNRDDLQGASELSDKKASVTEEEVVLGSSKNSESALVVGGRGGNGRLITVEDQNGYLIAVGRESSSVPASVAAAEDEDEDEEEGSTEELNKKCDDFIRNFKHRIKTEAQRQLVVV
ncbi:uncharacterized protein LOC122094192 [Macadamia integrifolia]|uniref:uncharacterized protein LOC122094192 n=1 Tax=Macadamia integrifolia TaxID=60698 RepID=UPI001C5338C0|nr:uncharacterized protein LOC122094192 [Macadamia integrifolia]